MSVQEVRRRLRDKKLHQRTYVIIYIYIYIYIYTEREREREREIGEKERGEIGEKERDANIHIETDNYYRTSSIAHKSLQFP